MGKYEKQLTLITGGRAIEAYRQQQQRADTPDGSLSRWSAPPNDVVDYVPANEAQVQASQIIQTQNNHYHHYPAAPKALPPPPKETSSISDGEAILWFILLGGGVFFFLGFIFSTALR